MKLPQNLRVVFLNIITLILKNYTFSKIDPNNRFIKYYFKDKVFWQNKNADIKLSAFSIPLLYVIRFYR